MPFWLSRSTRISTVMCDPSHSLTRVAIEYGSSSRVTASSCSRTSSATHCSARHVADDVGREHRRTDRGPADEMANQRLESVPALRRHGEVGLGTELAGGGELGEHLGRDGRRSTLLTTTTARGRSTWSATHRSPAPNGAVASTTRHTTSTVTSASFTESMAVALTLAPRAVTGLCRPGVSTNTS